MPLEIAGLYTYTYGPVTRQVVLLEPGVTAIYGLNGSGKSFFLQALADYAHGAQWGRGGLLLRFRDAHSPDGGGASHDAETWNSEGYRDVAGLWNQYAEVGLGDLTRADIHGALLDGHAPDESALADALGRDGFNWNPTVLGYATAADSHANRQIIDDVLDHGYLLAQPRQARDPARSGDEAVTWALWPVLLDLSHSPGLRTEVARFAAAADVVRERMRPFWDFDSGDSEVDPAPGDEWYIDAVTRRASQVAIEEFGLDQSLLMNAMAPLDSYTYLESLPSPWDGPYFLRSIGQLRGRPWWGLTDNLDPHRLGERPLQEDCDALTRDALTRTDTSGWQIDAAPVPADIAADLQTEVGDVLRLLLMEPPTLELQVGTTEELICGTHPRWVARLDRPGQPLSMDDLSRAQRRWAQFAIRVACQARRRQLEGAWRESWLWILDEPETALHRSAEEHLAAGLSELARRYRATVVAATHSPELLDDPRTHVLQARRDGQATILTPLAGLQRDGLAGLGLRPSDLLRRQRAFLIVEGAHEVAVLSALADEDLRSMRVQVLPAHGARKFVAAIDSQILFEFTDATVVFAIDNTHAAAIRDLWAAARRTAQVGDVTRAGEVLRENLPKSDRAENIFLSQFLSRALETGQHERVEVFGLSKPDITEYLPIERFTSLPSWTAAREAWEASGSKPDFKKWLSGAHGADFSPTHVHEVASSLPHLPDDLIDLMGFLASVVDRAS